ncbi:MAG: dockerin type I repeat-containing protein [Ruminococcus sp.]|nr:dockerin type I repeat-containing protein [Ruminococcus sp.]
MGTYILGDADGDGQITVLDATKVQRVLVDLDDDPDGMITLRGDSNRDGLDVMDATRIQRYIADYEIAVPIGEVREIVEPTESSTEPATAEPTTQLPTGDPNELPFVPVH